MAAAKTFFDHVVKDKNGKPHDLSQYRGKVILVVNTASHCGFTTQFEGLESLRKSVTQKYPNDFEILAFPCRQFNNQEFEENHQIQDYCVGEFNLTFPLLARTDVNGDKAEEVWTWMKKERPGLFGIMERVKWNFEKFLIGRDGQVKGRWPSTKEPQKLEKIIVQEIEKAKETS